MSDNGLLERLNVYIPKERLDRWAAIHAEPMDLETTYDVAWENLGDDELINAVEEALGRA